MSYGRQLQRSFDGALAALRRGNTLRVLVPESDPMLKRLAKTVTPDWLWRRMSEIKERVDVRTFRPYVVQHRYGGWEFRVHIADATSRAWYDHDLALPAEIDILARARLRAGATVFDLGAHQCVIAAMLARLVGDAGHVVAVEASEHNYRVGLRNLAENCLSHVALLHAAGGEAPGAIRFDGLQNGQIARGKTGLRASHVVPVVTVDQLASLHGTPAVLFVDVEGYECQVLRGATSTLETRPDCYVEVHSRCGLEQFGSVDELLGFFLEREYEVLVSPVANGAHFVPLREGRHHLASHSRLVALARS